MATAHPAAALAFPEARRLVEQHAASLQGSGPAPVPLRQSLGRVLAEDVAADRDLPPFPRATRDGYALRAAALAQLPARLEVAGEIRAGAPASEFARELQSGQAVEIMTGAPVPPGADAVVMLEYTRREGGGAVVVERSAAAGENIVPAGAEARRGQVVLKARTRLGPAHMAVAAAVGVTQIAVYRRPRVAILATGDEIVEAGAQPGPSQIRNSNSYSLAAQVEAAGGEAVILDIAPDQRQPLRRLLA